MISAQKQASAVRYLKKVERKLKKTETVSYNSVVEYKGTGDSDTLKYKASLKYSVNPRDFFFGYDLWYSDGKYYSAYYSLGKSYNISHIGKKIYFRRFLDPKKTDLKAGPFGDAVQGKGFAVFLKDKDFFGSVISDDSYRIRKISKGLCPDTVHIRAEYILQNTEITTDTLWDFAYDFYFDRKSRFPVMIVASGKSSGGSFYSKVCFEDIVLNSDDTRNFFLSYRLPADYALIKPKVRKTHSDTLPHILVKATDFTVIDQDGNQLHLSDLQGKVVLLDFWYSTCAPCIKASKYLDEYYRQYSDSGLVILGMNPIDGLARIKQHNKKWNVGYVGVKCDEKTKNDYDVSSYPTFILIDRNGMIVYRNSGFSKSMMESIKLKIEETLGR
jgi:cytochrome oxidase Cu insertion factor (SCO1/SenC/PrrC family)